MSTRSLPLPVPGLVSRGWAYLAGVWRRDPGLVLLAGGLCIYLLTRLWALADYPIFFFSDEANQTMLALDLWRDGLRGYSHELLPTYFQNVYQYNLSISVYLQLLPALLLGRSVELTRGVPALISLLAPFWLAWTLRKVYRSPYPWLAALLLSAAPAWLLHSRTAFEASLAVTFYTGFLAAYLRYRAGQDRALYAAVGWAALAFYTYSPAQVVLAVTALLFFGSDLGYHRRRPGLMARATGLALLCTLPYLRFQLNHPGETAHHLAWIGSYWFQEGALLDKLGEFAVQYLRGLDPRYWFLPAQDLARHSMGPYGHLLLPVLPFALAGVGLAVWRFRRWEYRAPLLALLAAPSGAALVGLGITRVLFLLAPLCLLTGLLLSELLAWAALRWPRRPNPAGYPGGAGLALVTWLLLAAAAPWLLVDALWHGPTWSSDYGLAGMQYGARQVFGEALRYTQSHPGQRMIVSPAWTNGTDVVARFFLPDPLPVELAGIDSWLFEKRELDEGMLFVLPPEELERAQLSGKFSEIRVEKMLAYPDRRPGFYFVRLRYVKDIDAILASEQQDRVALEQGEVELDGQVVQVQVSRLDMGEIGHLFDGNPETFVRTLAANPLRLRLQFPVARALRGLALRIGGAPSALVVEALAAGEAAPRRWERQVGETPLPRNWELDFGETLPITALEIRLSNAHDPEPAHVHLWEIDLR